MYQKRFRLMSTAVAIVVASCVCSQSVHADPPGKRSRNTKVKAADQQKAADQNHGPAQPAKAAKGATGIAVPPADAQITLYVLPVVGLSHVEQAKTLKEQLIAQTGLKDFYIVHGETDSTLYYGYYKDFMGTANPKEKARAEAERMKIAGVKDRGGDLPFRGATFVNIDTPDPEGPAEWNLANTPTDRVWTWEIAAYADHPQRKQAAIDAVRAARESGIEAYYFHGSKASSVCIGAFREDALKPQDSNVQNKAEGSDAPLVILPSALPAGVNEDDLYINQNGRRVKATVVVPRIEPQDPKLVEVMQAYPYYSYNGEDIVTVSKDPRTGRQVQKRQTSKLVTIKHPNDATANGEQPGAGGLGQPLLTPDTRSRTKRGGAGALRGIGE